MKIATSAIALSLGVLLLGAGCTDPVASVSADGDIDNAVFTLAIDESMHIDTSSEMGGRYEVLAEQKTDNSPTMGENEYYVEYIIDDAKTVDDMFTADYTPSITIPLNGQMFTRGEFTNKGGEMAEHVMGYYRPGDSNGKPGVLFRISADTQSGLSAGTATVFSVSWK